jgi:transcriptional regulator with XRE-family HTH domain
MLGANRQGMQQMTLTQYRTAHGIPMPACADWLGVTLRTLYRWERGESIPSPAMQAHIRHKTKGDVRPDDWINGLNPNRPRRVRR